jgi:hypothetical protein
VGKQIYQLSASLLSHRTSPEEESLVNKCRTADIALLKSLGDAKAALAHALP